MKIDNITRSIVASSYNVEQAKQVQKTQEISKQDELEKLGIKKVSKSETSKNK